MTEAQVHGALVRAVIAVAAVTFLFLQRVTAPCGRHYAGAGWGSHMPGRLGWIVLEAPAVAVFAGVCLDGKSAGQVVPLAFLAMRQVHYLNRTFVYPLREARERVRPEARRAVTAAGKPG